MVFFVGITVQGNPVTVTSGGVAVIDIGANYISGPAADVQAIWKAIPGSQALTGGLAGYFSFRT